MIRHGRIRGRERGSAVAVEATLIIPALVLFVALVILLARNSLTDQAVTSAAAQAARAASIERTVPEATSAARTVASAALTEAAVGCLEHQVVVDASGLTAPIGQRATVEVTLTCTIRHDLSFPGFPSTRTVVTTMASPVDTYRGR